MCQGVDLTVLMAAIHEFFTGLGVDEIRRRGSADDKPLRMVKTLLHELCKHEVGTDTAQLFGQHVNADLKSSRRLGQGQNIRGYMDAIPHNCEPAPIIHAYVDLNLQTLASAGLIAGPSFALRKPSMGHPEQVTEHTMSLLLRLPCFISNTRHQHAALLPC